MTVVDCQDVTEPCEQTIVLEGGVHEYTEPIRGE